MTLTGITTRQQLADLLNEYKGNHIDPDEQVRDYKYVIYIRKSTDDKDKQVRSVKDQIAECEEHAKREGLYYDPLEIIIEKQSAKTPDKRPKFRQMLDDLKAGKYDGIIAWHPDRLSRNMKEAGEIIDMLDKQDIKDLQFSSFAFQNTTAGLTLLGITFVMSKQYSDALRDGVNRGNKKSLEEGRYINKTKHGYYKDEDGYLRPDAKSFEQIQKAFQMRLEGKTLNEIGTYLEGRDYTIKKKHGRVTAKMDKQKVAKILSDPIYTGVLLYGDRVVDLVEAGNFVPAVSVEDFMKINQVDDKSKIFKMVKSHISNEGIQASVLRGMVYCSECEKPLTIQLVQKETKNLGKFKYLTYRCDTKDCERKNKSTRAKVIIDYVVNFLEQSPFSNKEAFAKFEEEIQRLNIIRISDKDNEQRSLQARINKKQEKLEQVKNTLYKTEDPDLQKTFRADFKMYQKDLKSLEVEKRKLQEEIKQIKQSPFTYEEFIELWEKVLNTLKNLDKTTTAQEIDFYVKKLYLNFFVNGKSVVKSTLSPPFDALEASNVSNGGRCRT